MEPAVELNNDVVVFPTVIDSLKQPEAIVKLKIRKAEGCDAPVLVKLSLDDDSGIFSIAEDLCTFRAT